MVLKRGTEEKTRAFIYYIRIYIFINLIYESNNRGSY